MFGIPNRRIRRSINFLKDGKLTDKRWKSAQFLRIDSLGLTLPRDQDLLSKRDDPDWRINWNRFALLRYPLDEVPYYVFILENGKVMRTRHPITTACVAMRAGPDVVKVMMKSVTGKTVRPELCLVPHLPKSRIFRPEYVELMVAQMNVDVTHI